MAQSLDLPPKAAKVCKDAAPVLIDKIKARTLILGHNLLACLKRHARDIVCLKLANEDDTRLNRPEIQ